MSDLLQQRFEMLLSRLQTSYDGIGHSSGRPYLYFVYPPREEAQVQRMVGDQMQNSQPGSLFFCHIDVLEITVNSLRTQEERRQQYLNDPLRKRGTTEAILKLWARRICQAIDVQVKAVAADRRPVVVLRNLAALHPLGNPTTFMEFLSEMEPRCAITETMIPIVLFVPGYRPPQTSRLYWFLDQASLQFDFYRGEEI